MPSDLRGLCPLCGAICDDLDCECELACNLADLFGSTAATAATN